MYGSGLRSLPAAGDLNRLTFDRRDGDTLMCLKKLDFTLTLPSTIRG